MTLSEISIRRPVFAWMLFAATLLFGFIGLSRMGVSQLPDVDFPNVNISVNWEGASAEAMEANITEFIEEAVMSVSGIKSISSSNRNGSANISVEFNLSKDINIAVNEIQTAVLQVQRRLPKDIDTPIISKSNPEDQPIMWFRVTSDRMTERELMTFVREKIRDQFATVEGVAEVFLGGYVEPNLRVWVSSEKLGRYALTVSDIVTAIQQEHSETPGGRIEGEKQEMNVRTLGEALTPEDFKNLAILRRGGGPNFVPIPLGSVAEIEDGLADVRRRSRSMGKPAVGLGIKKLRGVNAVAVAKAAKKRAEKVQQTLPEGMSVANTFDATQFIEESVNELKFTLLAAAILTAIVCWIFLGSWSATMNVILSIPFSVVGTFFILYQLGFTLNAFTLLGLSLAIGIVVDDAIMVLENIVRHAEMGKSRLEAALIGSREITFAAVAATAALAAIFLPVTFMSGLIGKFMYQFGMTLSVAVFLSLLEALTLAPMRCSQFLKVGQRTTRFGKFVEFLFHESARVYQRALPWILSHRGLTIIASGVIFALSLGTAKFLKKEFVPPQDQSRLMLRIQTPVGSSLEFTDEKFKQIEKIVAQDPDLASYYAAIGGFGGGEVNTGIMFLTFRPPKERAIDKELTRRPGQMEIGARLRKQILSIQDVRVSLQDLSLSGFTGGGRGFPVEFTLRGPEWEKLAELTQTMMDKMEATGKMVDVDTNYQTGMPEIQVIPNREKALQRGVSVTEMSQTINALMGGATAGKYSHGNRRYDIRVRITDQERKDPADLKKILIRNNRGELIPLTELARFESKPRLQAIYHQERERAIKIFANVKPGSSQEEALTSVQQIAKETLPNGYMIFLEGSSEAWKDTLQSLIIAIALGILIAYMILGSQFNSFVHPITVLVALPFSLSGAFLALKLAGESINMYSMIGILLLMGIVKKNSILLVDFTNEIRKRGKGVHDALLEACPIRLRPILMTTVSTVAGALPAALAIGPGAEIRVPMAVSVIGGVIVSTFLTLLVVPAVYSLFSRGKVSGVDNLLTAR